MSRNPIVRAMTLKPRACGVLIADDEVDILDTLAPALRVRGFRVWCAAGGRKAVNLFRDRRKVIDVVLLDVHMPHMDGPQALSAIQAIAPQISCCFMSGDLGLYSESELQARGAHSVLAKPVRIEPLINTLRMAL